VLSHILSLKLAGALGAWIYEELIFTTIVRGAQDSNPGSDGYEPSTLPLSYRAIPITPLMSLVATHQ